MGKLITPRVYFVGFTTIDNEGLSSYLRDTRNDSFLLAIEDARRQGLSDAEILTSFYAKLCYASLSLGKNENVSRIRDIPDNLKAMINSGHGSVFEHAQLNFVATDCSRVFTHELVRHRVGTAFSQTSGRYVRTDEIDIVFDPILEPVKEDFQDMLEFIERQYKLMSKKMGMDNPEMSFHHRKKITSALRRGLPNGQSNEIGFSLNLRSLRHTIMMRTAVGAEWEIREIFGQVYRLVKTRFPSVFLDAHERVVDDLVEVYGMKMQPYEQVA